MDTAPMGRGPGFPHTTAVLKLMPPFFLNSVMEQLLLPWWQTRHACSRSLLSMRSRVSLTMPRARGCRWRDHGLRPLACCPRQREITRCTPEKQFGGGVVEPSLSSIQRVYGFLPIARNNKCHILEFCGIIRTCPATLAGRLLQGGFLLETPLSAFLSRERNGGSFPSKTTASML